MPATTLKIEGTLPRMKVHTDPICSFTLFLLQVPDRLATMTQRTTIGWDEARSLLPPFPLENPGIWSYHRRAEGPEASHHTEVRAWMECFPWLRPWVLCCLSWWPWVVWNLNSGKSCWRKTHWDRQTKSYGHIPHAVPLFYLGLFTRHAFSLFS